MICYERKSSKNPEKDEQTSGSMDWYEPSEEEKGGDRPIPPQRR